MLVAAWCIIEFSLAMDVGVGLGLAMGVDRKKAEACGGEEPKDVRREERGLGDPFVGDGSSTRTYTPLVVRSPARDIPQKKTQTTKLPDPAVVARTPFWSFCAG